jgi:hypothetical protein
MSPLLRSLFCDLHGFQFFLLYFVEGIQRLGAVYLRDFVADGILGGKANQDENHSVSQGSGGNIAGDSTPSSSANTNSFSISVLELERLQSVLPGTGSAVWILKPMLIALVDYLLLLHIFWCCKTSSRASSVETKKTKTNVVSANTAAANTTARNYRIVLCFLCLVQGIGWMLLVYFQHEFSRVFSVSDDGSSATSDSVSNHNGGSSTISGSAPNYGSPNGDRNQYDNQYDDYNPTFYYTVFFVIVAGLGICYTTVDGLVDGLVCEITAMESARGKPNPPYRYLCEVGRISGSLGGSAIAIFLAFSRGQAYGFIGGAWGLAGVVLAGVTACEVVNGSAGGSDTERAEVSVRLTSGPVDDEYFSGHNTNPPKPKSTDTKKSNTVKPKSTTATTSSSTASTSTSSTLSSFLPFLPSSRHIPIVFLTFCVCACPQVDFFFLRKSVLKLDAAGQTGVNLGSTFGWFLGCTFYQKVLVEKLNFGNSKSGIQRLATTVLLLWSLVPAGW